MPRRMSTIVEAVPQLIASATLHVDTSGAGLIDITENAVTFTAQVGAGDGVLLVYLRHTSASLTIQENADPDVQAHLTAALDPVAPVDSAAAAELPRSPLPLRDPDRAHRRADAEPLRCL